jgi:hypothetical protein
MSLEASQLATHTPDGTDAMGVGLEVQIRIGPDGRMHFHDIPPWLVDVVLALNPTDPSLVRRLKPLAPSSMPHLPS